MSSVICCQHSVTLCSGRFQLCVCSIWFFIIVYILRLTTQQYANLPATQTVHMLFTAIICCWNVILTMLTGNPLIILRMNIKLNFVVQFQNSAVQIHGLQKEKLCCCRKTMHCFMSLNILLCHSKWHPWVVGSLIIHVLISIPLQLWLYLLQFLRYSASNNEWHDNEILVT